MQKEAVEQGKAHNAVSLPEKLAMTYPWRSNPARHDPSRGSKTHGLVCSWCQAVASRAGAKFKAMTLKYKDAILGIGCKMRHRLRHSL